MPAVPSIDLAAKPKNKKIIFGDDSETHVTEKTTFPKENKPKPQKKKTTDNPENVDAKPKNKKIIFDDEGEAHINEITTLPKEKRPKKKKFTDNFENDEIKEETNGTQESEKAAAADDYFTVRENKQNQKQQQQSNEYDAQKKWYHVYAQYPSTDEVLDMKESEQMELYNLCKSSFESEQSAFNKRNPSDARWLQTALHKGTAKDRANGGALLVASNPVGNLEALSTLIGYTKLSNKSSTEVISILTDLWQEVLLPPNRKLLSLQLRGADWKLVRKDTGITKEQLKRIYAYWYFENDLKDLYFEFLKNIQQGIQTGQENNKTCAIIASAQLLAYAPEKEQMLLTMLVNKLGDPLPKIASKALHHLTDVAHRHPNMCAVIVAETEKLLFRNNVSDRAQHFALCFLANIAPAGNADVCTKLVNMSFALFKVLVHKGAVNTRIMQAILRCLQKAILDAAPAKGSTDILSKEMQDTIYRLVHVADIRVSVQTLGLLMQLITVKTEKSDRFYNALYVKLMDLELSNIGSKTAAHLLHIVHRAIHLDTHLARAQAFIKRLLQLALYMPPHVAAGCLIVLSKLLRSRKELENPLKTIDANGIDSDDTVIVPTVSPDDEELARFDSDGEEKYEDIKDGEDGEDMQKEVEAKEEKEEKPATTTSSWHHSKVTNKMETQDNVRDIGANKYDAYHRVPAFAGAEYALRNELLLLCDHYHPTVQVFAESILNKKRIAYYGDPLRDFSLPHFLERFAFKNPKKLDSSKAESAPIAHKRYKSFGPRGRPVKTLTKESCTEDEMFIFNFLEHKRQVAALAGVRKTKSEDNEDVDNDELKPTDVDDDEFEDYLDGFFGKKAKDKAELGEDDEDVDFLKELGGETIKDKQSKKKSKKVKKMDDDEDNLEEIDADWGDDMDGETDFDNDDGTDVSDDDVGSIDEGDLSDDDDDDDGSISLGDDDDKLEEDDDDEDGATDDLSEMEDGSDLESDAELAPPKSKKSRKQNGKDLDGKSFAKTLKHSDDMSSLFAAADDFADLLEETGKTKGHGTTNAIFNKDKSSDKQMKWEEKRHSNTKPFAGKKKFASSTSKKAKGGAGAANGRNAKFTGKKRKH